MNALEHALHDVAKQVSLGAHGHVRVDAEEVPARSASDALARLVHERYVQGRAAKAAPSGRASGDSGFVAHLTHSSHGSTLWEHGWRMAKADEGWAFVSNGRLCLFLDEPGQWAPADARLGASVAVRMPRVRENYRPYRFTLLGGGGPAAHARYTKYFVQPSLESTGALVEAFSGRATEAMAFSLMLVNDPRDFHRRDVLVIDASGSAADQVLRMLVDFSRQHPGALRHLGAPLFAREVAPGVASVDAAGLEDQGDGFGQRRARWVAEAVLAGLQAGEKEPKAWKARLVAMGLA